MESHRNLVARSRRHLWIAGAVLLGALTVTVVSLSAALDDRGPFPPALANPATVMVGLCALVLVFVLYVFHRERELRSLEVRLQETLVREAALRERVAELSALFDAATQLAVKLDLRAMLGLAARRILACLDADQSSIMLYNPQRKTLEVRVTAGVDASLVEGAALETGQGIAGYVFSSGEPLVLNPQEMRARFAQEVKLGRHIASALSVPMRFQGTTLGVFNVCRVGDAEEFSPFHARLLMSFAEHCAAAIVKQQHYRRVFGTGRKAA